MIYIGFENHVEGLDDGAEEASSSLAYEGSVRVISHALQLRLKTETPVPLRQALVSPRHPLGSSAS